MPSNDPISKMAKRHLFIMIAFQKKLFDARNQIAKLGIIVKLVKPDSAKAKRLKLAQEEVLFVFDELFFPLKHGNIERK